jgi:ribulose 1,5-bisphosphate synthetase/thiazole synthase
MASSFDVAVVGAGLGAFHAAEELAKSKNTKVGNSKNHPKPP